MKKLPKKNIEVKEVKSFRLSKQVVKALAQCKKENKEYSEGDIVELALRSYLKLKD